MTLPRHDDQLIQVIALPPQFADEVIHAVDDCHILVHGRVPHILAERLVRLFRLKRDVFLLPSRHADADKFFFLHRIPLSKISKSPKRKPSAAGFVWRRNARKQLEFSPEAETEAADFALRKGCGLSPHAAFGERFRPGAENRTTNAKLAIAPKARCSAFPNSQRPVTLVLPCEATQWLIGANAAVLWLAPTVSAVPAVARRRLRRGTAGAGCTTPPPLGWGECDNAGCRFSSGRSA